MPADSSKDGTATEKLHFCDKHKNACGECPTCKTYSYCPDCKKCYEPSCPDS